MILHSSLTLLLPPKPFLKSSKGKLAQTLTLLLKQPYYLAFNCSLQQNNNNKIQNNATSYVAWLKSIFDFECMDGLGGAKCE